MPRDDASLIDIDDACRPTMRFIEGFDEQPFYEDERTQAAVVRQLEIIGEAVKRLSPGFRQLNSDVDWRRIAGTRDRLIHEYDTVDIEEVWNMATRDVPALRQYLQPLLPPQS